jgi:hypothetical protein
MKFLTPHGIQHLQRITTEYNLKHLNVDQLEGETLDTQAGDGRISFTLRARNRLRSLNYTAQIRQDISCGLGEYSAASSYYK